MKGPAEKIENTKVSMWAHKRLEAIAASANTTIYKMIQNMCYVLIRYMSKDTNISPEMERAISLFESIEDWKDQFNLCDCGDFQVEEALYFIGNEKKKGVAAVMIKRPFFGKWTQSVNVQNIFEAIICKIFPSRYRKLRLLATEWGCTSQLEVLDRLLDNELQGIDTQSIREEFEDCNRSDYGTRPSDHQYKRKHRRDIEKVQGLQQTIHFSPDDVPDTDNEDY